MRKIDRFDKYMKYCGLNDNKVTRELCLSIGTISKSRKDKRDLSDSVIEQILNRYDDLNRVWLLTGEGEMLTSAANNPKSAKEPVKSLIAGVPYYDVDFIGGFDPILNDQRVTPEYLIDFKKYNDADCWCNITGHSMEPEISNGDIIALKEVPNWAEFLPLGEVYAIVTNNDLRTIKRITAGKSEGYYTLIPANKSPEYCPQEISKDMISRVFQVLGCMKRL